MSLRHRGFGSACLVNVYKTEGKKGKNQTVCSAKLFIGWHRKPFKASLVLLQYGISLLYRLCVKCKCQQSRLYFSAREYFRWYYMLVTNLCFFFFFWLRWVYVVQSGNDVCLWLWRKTAVLPQGSVTDRQGFVLFPSKFLLYYTLRYLCD